jgi:hypothetical protein
VKHVCAIAIIALLYPNLLSHETTAAAAHKAHATTAHASDTPNPADLEGGVLEPSPGAWLPRMIVGAVFLLIVGVVVDILRQRVLTPPESKLIDPYISRQVGSALQKCWEMRAENGHPYGYLVGNRKSPPILLHKKELHELHRDKTREGCGRLYCPSLQEYVGVYWAREDRRPNEHANQPVFTVMMNHNGSQQRLVGSPCL